MFDALTRLLNFFYDLYPSYGVAIVLFTVTIMLALFPFTAKSARSMVEMQRIQPEIKKLQQKHKNDRQALNEAMMELYKEHGVNPISGCLPLLLQLPVFFVLFRVLDGLTRGFNPENAESFPAVCRTLEAGEFCPKYLPPDSALFQALFGDTQMKSFGIDLASSAAEAVSRGFLDALPYVLLVGLTILTGWYQQRQTTRRNPQQQVSDDPQAQMMRRMGTIMPIMFGVFSWTFRAGLVLYFVVSNLFRIVQQGLLYRYDPTLRRHVEEKRKAVAPPAGAARQSTVIETSAEPKRAAANGQSGAAKARPQQRKKKRKGR